MKSISNQRVGLKSSNVLLSLIIISLFMLTSCNKKAEPIKTVETEAAGTTDSATVKPADPPANFKHATAFVNGVNIHYVIGGKGDPLVLVHGFGQNWYMWNRLLTELSKHFTVIAPD